jgi:hypothetical protein
MRKTMLIAAALAQIAAPAAAQTYSPEITHSYEYDREGVGSDLLCTQILFIAYESRLSPSGISAAFVKMVTGLRRQPNDISVPRMLVVFSLQDGVTTNELAQVPAAQFFMFAGKEIIPPSASTPCPGRATDICHVMRPVDETMLELYLSQSSANQRKQAFDTLRPEFRQLQEATVADWGIGFSRANLANSMVLLKVPPAAVTPEDAKKRSKYGECIMALFEAAKRSAR